MLTYKNESSSLVFCYTFPRAVHNGKHLLSVQRKLTAKLKAALEASKLQAEFSLAAQVTPYNSPEHSGMREAEIKIEIVLSERYDASLPGVNYFLVKAFLEACALH